MLNLYPYHIFFSKVVNQITHRKNKFWRFLPVSIISVRGLGDVPDKKAFKPQLLSVIGDIYDVVSQVSEKDRATILSSANQTLDHQFEYLGSGKVNMPKIKWNEDFKTGNKWRKGLFYLKQRQLTAKGADIKVPWELSRGHHLLWLGEAYLITHEDKYAQEVVDEIEDWLCENPFMYSVNWACTMDVAIRAVNWMYAVGMVMGSPAVTDVFIAKLFKSFYQHAWFIYNNLERTVPYSNNHLFSDLVGLVYLGLLFQDSKKGGQWLDYAIVALYEEIRVQVLPSGVHFERSVSYHRLMTEMVISSIYVLKRNGVSVPADIEYRAGSMLLYIDIYTKPNKRSPLVEDNDDGRFLPFVRRDFREHNYLTESNSTEILFISEGIEPVAFEKNSNSRLFYDAGHAVIRKDEVYLFITNGEQSGYDSARQTIGTHTHNDKLSFEFSLGEDDIIIDPGAYIYTPEPEKSNEFRSTLKHNTVVVDGEEQNFITPQKVFLATKNSRKTCFYRSSDTYVVGEYSTFKGEMTHRREIEVLDNSMVLIDQLSKKGENHTAVLSFHLAPQIEVQMCKNGFELKSSSYLISLSFEKPMLLELVGDTVSPSYGVLEQSKTMRAKCEFENDTIIKTIIQWKKRQ